MRIMNTILIIMNTILIIMNSILVIMNSILIIMKGILIIMNSILRNPLLNIKQHRYTMQIENLGQSLYTVE